MTVTPPGVIAAQLPNPRQFDPRSTRDLSVNDSAFSVVDWTFPAIATSVSTDSTWILATGTVLQVIELVGATTIGVRFDVNGPFLPVQEGDVIHARFERVQFRSFVPVNRAYSYVANDGRVSDVVVQAIASNGLRIDKAPRREGFSNQFVAWTGTATTSGVNVLAAWDAIGNNNVPFQRPTPGKGGGQLLLKNTGGTTMYLYSQNPANGTTWYPGSAGARPSERDAWPIAPGESMAIPLKSYTDTFCLGTLAGTTTFAAIADSATDLRVQKVVSL